MVYRDLERTVQSIARLSSRDARAYAELFEYSKGIMELVAEVTAGPAPKLTSLVAMLEESDEGLEFLRIMQMSIKKVVEEWFEDERLRAALAKYCVEQPCTGPDENGTGLFVLYAVNGARRKGLPVGGSGRLTEALAACIEDMGGVIRTSSGVEEIRVRDGRATSVRLADGTVFDARRAVVADVHIRQLVAMVGEDALGPDFSARVRRMKDNNVAAFVIHAAMSEAPRYRAAELDGCFSVEVSPTMEQVVTHFEEVMRGVIPRGHSASPLLKCNSVLDPSRAPAGKHVGYFYSFMPYELRDGGAAMWDQVRDEVTDSVLDTVREEAPNLSREKILSHRTLTPLDLERMNTSFIRGQINHSPMVLYQMMSLRPFPRWGGFRTPVGGLYLIGPSSSSGGGVAGGARSAAYTVLQDLCFENLDAILGATTSA